jgi:flagellar hook assembly protein FlgD
VEISFSVPRAGRVHLAVYDLNGRLVRTVVDEERRAGVAAVEWSGTNASGSRLDPGIYFIKLESPGVRIARKVVLLR